MYKEPTGTKSESIDNQIVTDVFSLKRKAYILHISWAILVVSSFLWGVSQKNSEVLNMAISEGRAAYLKDIIYRKWVADYGGVYVPVTPGSPPNPYLSKIPNRDVTTNNGMTLTLINPAYMTRQVHNLGKKNYGIQGKLTRESPLNPINKPDAWEEKALKELRRGENEYVSYENIDNIKYLRMMIKMNADKSCMQCHPDKNPVIGGMAGGMSLTVPMDDHLADKAHYIKIISIIHFFLYLFGAVSLIISFRKLYLNIGTYNDLSMKFRNADRKQSKLLKNIPIMVVRMSRNLNILDVNDEAVKTVGVERNQILNNSFYKIFNLESDRKCIDKEIHNISTDTLSSYEFDHELAVNGSDKRYISWRIFISADEESELIALGSDVTNYKNTLSQLKENENELYHKIELSTENLTKINEKLFGEIVFRKNVENTLIESIDRLEAITSSANDGIVLVDTNWQVILWNASAERIFGRTNEEICGNSFLSCIYDNISEYANEEHFNEQVDFEDCATQGQTVEVTGIREDGTEIPVELSISHVYIKGNKNILMIIRDVTERKIEQELVLLERRKFLSFLEMIPAFVYVVDESYNVLYTNQLFRNYFGNHFDGKCYNVMHGKEHPCLNCESSKILKNKSMIKKEWEDKKGRTFITYENYLEDNEGKKIIIIGVDITEEVALRKRKELYSNLLDKTTDMIFIIDVKRNYVVDCNKVVVQNLNYSTDDFYGIDVNEIFKIDGISRFNISALIKDKMMEAKCIAKTGEMIDVEISISESLEDKEHFVVTIARDITKRKESERLVEESNKKIEKANNIKALFIANMSHEIRTPLTAIMGMTDILHSDIQDTKQRGYLKTISSAAQSLLSMLNDIIEFTKTTYEEYNINLCDTDLRNVVADVKKMFEISAAKKDIELRANVSVDFPLYVMTDELRVRQVLYNLIGNAVKYTNKGFVEVNVFLAGPIARGSDTFPVIINVADSGIGISESDKEYVFDEYYQIKSIKEKTVGTGLGLAITKKIVEKMGGNISFESTLGEGSLFSVMIQCYKSDNCPRATEEVEIIETATEDIELIPLDLRLKYNTLRNEVKVILGDEVFDLFKDAYSTKSIETIEVFGKKLKYLSKNSNLQYLIMYADEILQAVSNFDIGGIEDSLNLFNEFTKYFENENEKRV